VKEERVSQHARGKRVQVFFGEADRIGRKPAYEALLEYLRREGAAGATITRGMAGFGAASRIKTAAVLRLSVDLPMVLTWLDSPARVDRLLPGLQALVPSGITTVEAVEVVGYGVRQLGQLRFDLAVGDVMTRPAVTIAPAASLVEAVRALLDRPYRALPVVDEAARLVGVISNQDMTLRGGLAARIELLQAMTPEARARLLATLDASRTVADVMSTEPVSVSEEQTLAEASRLMSERRLKRLPVLDRSGRLAGIISRADVLRAVADSFPRAGEVPEDHPGARTVGELMRTDVPRVSADADLPTIVDEVASTRLNRAVVVDRDERVLGVLSDADVLRAVDPEVGGPVLGALMRGVGRPIATPRRAADLLSSSALTVDARTSLGEAARLMTSERRKVLVVVDADGRLAGIVDRADLLHAIQSTLVQNGPAAAGDGA
jgi:CBS domain-containing protein